VPFGLQLAEVTPDALLRPVQPAKHRRLLVAEGVVETRQRQDLSTPAVII